MHIMECVLFLELSHAKQEAFDTFRRDYKHNLVIESHKNTLRARYFNFILKKPVEPDLFSLPYSYADAKELGEEVNRSRTKISECELHSSLDYCAKRFFVYHIQMN